MLFSRSVDGDDIDDVDDFDPVANGKHTLYANGPRQDDIGMSSCTLLSSHWVEEGFICNSLSLCLTLLGEGH